LGSPFSEWITLQAIAFTKERSCFHYFSRAQNMSKPADTSIEIPTTQSCENYLLGLEAYNDLVDALCNDEHLHPNTPTGLPNQSLSEDHDQMMIGISAWIQRVPIPYAIDWEVPTHPQWLDTYQQTTRVGPMAFAINEVPIFH